MAEQQRVYREASNATAMFQQLEKAVKETGRAWSPDNYSVAEFEDSSGRPRKEYSYRSGSMQVSAESAPRLLSGRLGKHLDTLQRHWHLPLQLPHTSTPPLLLPVEATQEPADVHATIDLSATQGNALQAPTPGCGHDPNGAGKSAQAVQRIAAVLTLLDAGSMQALMKACKAFHLATDVVPLINVLHMTHPRALHAWPWRHGHRPHTVRIRSVCRKHGHLLLRSLAEQLRAVAASGQLAGVTLLSLHLHVLYGPSQLAWPQLVPGVKVLELDVGLLEQAVPWAAFSGLTRCTTLRLRGTQGVMREQELLQQAVAAMPSLTRIEWQGAVPVPFVVRQGKASGEAVRVAVVSISSESQGTTGAGPCPAGAPQCMQSK